MSNKDTSIRVPIYQKFLLTVDEANEYFGIGESKLRTMISNDPDAEYLLHNGTKVLIKREMFEQFINDSYSI